MWRANCSPMAPSPIMPVRFTAVVWSMLFAPLSRRCRRVHGARIVRQHHAVIALGGFRRHIGFAHIGEYALRRPRQGIAVAAAAGRIETKNVTLLQRIIRIARRQAFGLVAARIDPDVAGPAGAATRRTVRWNDVLHRADREPRVGEIEIFAADAEPAAIKSRAAGIADELEAHHAGRKFAFDDLDWRDAGVALVDGDGVRAVLGGTGAAAAGDNLVLHVALAGRGRAPADDDRAAAAAVGAYLSGHDRAERREQRVDQRMHGR